MELTRDELVQLVKRVFQPSPHESRLAILVDLPHDHLPDSSEWRQRRRMASRWVLELRAGAAQLGLDAHLVAYRNVRANNAPLPETGWVVDPATLPETADELPDAGGIPMQAILADHPILLALTELSATAPLKLAARSLGIRAATMPGFSASMIPALRLDYGEINRRVERMKDLLDSAQGARLETATPTGRHRLRLDLRHRTGHASGGVFTRPGTAGNLPSGEAYIVPYEGEREGDPSRSSGELPLQIDGELLLYRIRKNRIAEVVGTGPAAARERALVAAEPAYANVSELGLGVLSDFGLQPVGQILLDEKLGLHVAFGRSDHFGGVVGPEDFSSPEKAVHIDRVYLPQLQPDVCVELLTLETGDDTLDLIRGGEWLPGVW
jgi:hypothetical protein